MLAALSGLVLRGGGGVSCSVRSCTGEEGC